MSTTVRLSTEIVERLRFLGRKGETYDTIVRRLLGLGEVLITQAKCPSCQGDLLDLGDGTFTCPYNGGLYKIVEPNAETVPEAT